MGKTIAENVRIPNKELSESLHAFENGDLLQLNTMQLVQAQMSA